MDMIAVVLGLAALIVAIFGVLDVRKQVRRLLELEFKRMFSKVVHEMIWEFVEPTPGTPPMHVARDFQDFSILAKVLKPEHAEADFQDGVAKTALEQAVELANSGSATFKAGIDIDVAKAMISQWRNDKNAATLDKMFGKQTKLF